MDHHKVCHGSLNGIPLLDLWMSKWHTVTQHHVINVENDMFNHLDGIMQALAMMISQWKEDFTLQWSLCYRSGPNTKLKLLQWRVCSLFQYTSSILSRSCDHLECGTRESIFILRTRLLILPNTKRHSWSMWRINTVLNTDVCLSLNQKAFPATISSAAQQRLDLVNLHPIHMICPPMMKNTLHLKMWLKQCLDKRWHSTLSNSRMALFESTIWITKELGAS